MFVTLAEGVQDVEDSHRRALAVLGVSDAVFYNSLYEFF